eukprot:2458201-Prymnesium_polylepis.1
MLPLVQRRCDLVVDAQVAQVGGRALDDGAKGGGVEAAGRVFAGLVQQQHGDAGALPYWGGGAAILG